jgi:hypothetical protein
VGDAGLVSVTRRSGRAHAYITVFMWMWRKEIAMPVHIDDLQSTVEIQADHEPMPSTGESTTDEVMERARHERYRCNLERLSAEGYAD